MVLIENIHTITIFTSIQKTKSIALVPIVAQKLAIKAIDMMAITIGLLIISPRI
jgi:hypothetical protein